MILYYLRTAILYLLLIVGVRLMGKRQVGQMEPSEFVVTMLVANLASIPMQDEGIPLFSGIVPILTVLGAELVLSAASMGSIRLRRALCGKPVILIENGHILQNNLRRTRITADELTAEGRVGVKNGSICHFGNQWGSFCVFVSFRPSGVCQGGRGTGRQAVFAGDDH